MNMNSLSPSTKKGTHHVVVGGSQSHHNTRSMHSNCGSTKSGHNLSDTISDDIIQEIFRKSLPYISDSEEGQCPGRGGEEGGEPNCPGMLLQNLMEEEKAKKETHIVYPTPAEEENPNRSIVQGI